MNILKSDDPPSEHHITVMAHYRHLPGDVRIASDGTGAGTRVEVCGEHDVWHLLTCSSVSIEVMPGGGTLATIKIHNPHVEISCGPIHDSATSKG